MLRILMGCLLAALVVSCGPNDPRGDFKVFEGIGREGFDGDTFFRVIGSDGTPFRAEFQDQETKLPPVNGAIPVDYIVEDAREFVAGTFTKTAPGGQTLIVQLFVAGEVRDQDTTRAQGGTVSVSSPVD
jgi:hypothetical protein